MAGTGGALPNWHWYDGPAPPPKAWPIRVTAVPPAKGDEEGTTDEMIGELVKKATASEEKCTPSRLTSSTRFSVVAIGGEMHATSSTGACKYVPSTIVDPNPHRYAQPPSSPEPRTETRSPPEAGPVLGSTADTCGVA